jgi:hypothetical protein
MPESKLKENVAKAPIQVSAGAATLKCCPASARSELDHPIAGTIGQKQVLLVIRCQRRTFLGISQGLLRGYPRFAATAEVATAALQNALLLSHICKNPH